MKRRRNLQHIWRFLTATFSRGKTNTTRASRFAFPNETWSLQMRTLTETSLRRLVRPTGEAFVRPVVRKNLNLHLHQLVCLQRCNNDKAGTAPP